MWFRFKVLLLLLVLVFNTVGVASYVSDCRFFRSLAKEILPGARLTEQQIFEHFVDFASTELRQTSYEELPSGWMKLYYKFNPFHPSARDVIKYGNHPIGGCGGSSRVVLALLREAGIPGRVLILQGSDGRALHAVVNARIGGRWGVADPLYGIVFTRPDGRLATAEELRRDRGLFLANVARNPSYPTDVFTYDNFTLMNWNKVPVVLPAIRRLMAATVGEQRTSSIARPWIWMYPALASAFFFTAFAVLIIAAVETAGAAVRAQRRRKGRGALPGA